MSSKRLLLQQFWIKSGFLIATAQFASLTAWILHLKEYFVINSDKWRFLNEICTQFSFCFCLIWKSLVYNLVLLKVTLVESRDRIGGRVWDDNKSLGCCVGRGAQILNGCINNPISVLCVQVSPLLHTLYSFRTCLSWKKTFSSCFIKSDSFYCFLNMLAENNITLIFDVIG